ncbi:zinc finger protein 236-like [Lampris incognitus]|uniref:zinc finger protein 236-like n=1 Tax=Lampris incognitus TaxID=2546036 RepID=UPI0024B60A80|nr:zinc finger protein 236-like [Lampris incognitus]
MAGVAAHLMNSRVLHEQLSIIMGALTKAAVVEICEVVDEGYAVLHAEITRSRQENEDLKKKLHLIESIVVRGGGGGKAAESGTAAVSGAEAEGAHRGPDAPPDTRQASDAGGAGADHGARGTGREIPDVVLIKDEDSDSNGTFEEDSKTSSDGGAGVVLATSAQIRKKKRHWSGSEEVVCVVETSSEQRPLHSPSLKLNLGNQKKLVSQYTLDSPHSEPGCSGQLLGEEREAGGSVHSYSSKMDLDVQDFSLVSPASNTNRHVAYFGGHGGTDTLIEAPSPTNKGELDLNLTWTKPTKSQMAFAHFHQSKSMDSDAFGLKLVNIVGSTKPTDCQLSEGSNSTLEFDEADVMNFGLYRDPSGRPSHCIGQPGVNTKGKRFVCAVCSKTYATLQNLEVHTRIHTGERPFSCPQCGKKFTQSAHLKSHLSVHSGERPYSCSLCSKSFIVKYSLKLHMKKCHAAI